MRNRAYAVLLALGLAACGSEDGDETSSTVNGVAEGTPIDIDGDGITDGLAVDANGDGIVEGVDTDKDGIADKPLPQQSSGATAGGGMTANNGSQPVNNTAGGTTGGNVDIFQPDGGAGNGGTTGGTVVVNSKAKVNCGGSEVELDLSANRTCCETWTKEAWSATTDAVGNCDALEAGPFGVGGFSKAEVPSSCDSKDDCGGGSYCCFFLPPNGPPRGAGAPSRPYGRKCMSEATCNSGGFDGGGAAFSCNTAKDCPSSFTQCVAETSADVNANTIPRAWVKVCK